MSLGLVLLMALLLMALLLMALLLMALLLMELLVCKALSSSYSGENRPREFALFQHPTLVQVLD
ncbi:MAG: hypothetical protein EBT36_13275 [Betaproteobacteria bacterium]|nr:hypothetical protein [Betaproteobacteria bacterium]